MSTWPDYTEIASLKDYIHRIGAEAKNFRRFEITARVAGGYSAYKGTIFIDDKGKITIRGIKDAEEKTKIEPTEAEAAAIIEEYAALKAKGVKQPRAIEAGTNVVEAQRLALGVEDENWFVIVGSDRTKAIMCQQRWFPEKKDGESAYMPWTYFSDGVWRSMEPDNEDGLPLWKPYKYFKKNEEKQFSTIIMLHEGAKAARYCDWMCRCDDDDAREALAAHPWGSELRNYEHWGWIGGALNPRRVNWGELKNNKLNISKIVMVCDNDKVGASAAGPVARALKGQKLYVVYFDEGDDFLWPIGFDLADPWPKNEYFWNERGSYIGPSLNALMFPAIWATERVPTPPAEGKVGRPKNPVYKISPQFEEQWGYVGELNLFVSRSHRNRWYFDIQFNRSHKRFSDVDNIAELAPDNDAMCAHGVTYLPGDPRFKVREDATCYINTWTPGHVRANNNDPQPFIDYMKNLIPDDSDRINLMKYVATLIAKPQIRMMFGVLLYSQTQGIGKSTLMEKILTPIIGEHNVSSPSEASMAEASFNSWRSKKRLVLCHEIYSGHSRMVYNRLNSVITEIDFEANDKHIKQYSAKSWAHVIASSNSSQALNIPQEDRRWFIPKVTEEKKKPDYWRYFNIWLVSGGLGAIITWAENFVETEGCFQPYDEAPPSSLKNEMIENSKDDWQLIVGDLVDIIAEEVAQKGPLVILTKPLIDRLHDDMQEEITGRKFMPGKKQIAIEFFNQRKLSFKLVGMKKDHKGTRHKMFSIGCPNCKTFNTNDTDFLCEKCKELSPEDCTKRILSLAKQNRSM